MSEPAEQLYRTVRLLRRFEEVAVDLVRAGEIPNGIHPYIGQEAVAAGVCAALRDDDIVVSNHRGHGHGLAKGSDPGQLLAELLGRSTGVAGGMGGSLHPSDFAQGVYGATITVGHGAAIATGIAWAGAEAGRVVVSFFGDGAVNQGALLEAMNLAALWKAPQVFVCENNGYATTQRFDRATAGSVVGRAAAFDIPAETIDGMDPEAVYRSTVDAVERARAGGGPTLLECLTYRYDAHHTFEHKVRLRYRDEAEIGPWRERDPITLQGGRISAADRERIDAEVEAVMADALRFARDSPVPDPADAMAHVYAPGMPVRPGLVGC